MWQPETFDGDGKTDLVIANAGSNDVSLLRGNGDGTFGAAINFGAGANPRSMAVADFDGDGRADMAVADYDFGHPNSHNLSILLAAAPPATTTTLSSTPNPSRYGQPVALTASVEAPP